MSLSPDQCRLQFICHLFTFSERGRTHLLDIEGDDELAALKRVALDAQHFEMAAAIGAVIKRREQQTGMRYVERPLPNESGALRAEFHGNA